LGWFAGLCGSEDQLEFAGSIDLETLGSILVCMRMSTNHYRGGPAGYWSLDDLADDRLPENRAVEDIPNGPIGRAKKKRGKEGALQLSGYAGDAIWRSADLSTRNKKRRAVLTATFFSA
jgi:hypothetical protein